MSSSSMPVTVTLSPPGFTLSTKSSIRMASMLRGNWPDGNSSSLSCIITFCQSMNSLRSEVSSSELTAPHLGGHFLGGAGRRN